MDVEASPGADCLIVGGGLSGLAAAEALSRDGRTVQILEADDGVGGRARTVMYQGEPVDRGFQVLFRAYPETRRLLDAIGIGTDDLRPFERGFVVHDGAMWRRVRPADGRRLVSAGLASGRDAGRLALLAARAAITPDRRLLDADDDAESAAAYLGASGISGPAVDAVLRPLFGAILLDRDLRADPGYFQFLVAMMARGPAVLPVDGMGMIAARAAEAVSAAGGMIWTGVRVAAIDPAPDGRSAQGVILDDGRAVSARNIVIALDPPGAAALLEPVDPASARRLPADPSGAVSAAFALTAPLYRGRTILLDGADPDGDDRVDLVCQTTNVLRPGSPGPHIVIAQSATRGWTGVVDPERYAAAVGRRIEALVPGFPWQRVARLVDAAHHPWAQYRPTAGVRRDLPGPRTALANVFLAGDAVTHPSIEGAVSAGRRAARIVGSVLG